MGTSEVTGGEARFHGCILMQSLAGRSHRILAQPNA